MCIKVLWFLFSHMYLLCKRLLCIFHVVYYSVLPSECTTEWVWRSGVDRSDHQHILLLTLQLWYSGILTWSQCGLRTSVLPVFEQPVSMVRKWRHHPRMGGSDGELRSGGPSLISLWYLPQNSVREWDLLCRSTGKVFLRGQGSQTKAGLTRDIPRSSEKK